LIVLNNRCKLAAIKGVLEGLTERRAARRMPDEGAPFEESFSTMRGWFEDMAGALDLIAMIVNVDIPDEWMMDQHTRDTLSCVALALNRAKEIERVHRSQLVTYAARKVGGLLAREWDKAKDALDVQEDDLFKG
jgi:hypothetical protein